jgi:serine-type D-Ala-D-Ala carboxypeptidase
MSVEADRSLTHRRPPRASAGAALLIIAAGLAIALGWGRTLRSEAPPPTTLEASTAARPVLTAAAWERMVARVGADLERGAFPGAVLAVGVGGEIAGISAHGRHEWTERSAAVLADSTLFDLASVTKAVATTVAVMLLVEDGRMALDDPVRNYLPNFEGQFKERVTIRHLLTHTSGLPPGTRLNGTTPAEVLRRMQRTLIPVPPGREVSYSDVGFAILWAAAERAAGEPLPALLRRRVWEPLGMSSTRFLPGPDCAHCAPTLHLERPPRIPYRGQPADEMARRLGGIAGNAGLFSTAPDLARFAAMIAGGGALGETRVLSEESVRALTTQQPRAGNRAIGWEAYCPGEEREPGDPCARPLAYGHTGFTGTALHVDPGSGRWMVLLTNRTYLPRAASRTGELRADLWGILAE